MYRLFSTLVFVCFLAFCACQNGSAPASSSTTPTSKTSFNADGYELSDIAGGMQRALKKNNKDRMIEDGTLLNNQREGSWTSYHDDANNMPASVTSYKNGKKNGTMVRFGKTGQLEALANYVDDALNGPYTKYVRTKVVETSFYKNGQLEGSRKTFYDDGKIKTESSYVNGKRNGMERYYDLDGNVTIEYEYQNGERIKK